MHSAGEITGCFEEDESRIRPYTSTMTTTSRIPLNQGLEISRSERATWGGRRGVEKFVGTCAIVSGGAHGLVTQDHFQEWWGYGVFFLVTATCLIGFGLALITDAIDPRYMTGDVHRLRRLMYVAGGVGILGILGLYAVTRTAGIPLGPESGFIEQIGVVDLVAKVTELLALAGLVVLLYKTRARMSDG
jgi:hypothetical protein